MSRLEESRRNLAVILDLRFAWGLPRRTEPRSGDDPGPIEILENPEFFGAL